MTIGTGIFLGSLVLGAVALFGITKDRWSWAKIAKRLGVGVLAIGLLFGAVVGWVYFERMSEGEKARIEEQRAAKEAAAEKHHAAEVRLCIAGDLNRMEILPKRLTTRSTKTWGSRLPRQRWTS